MAELYEEEQEGYDPFAASNVHQAQLIVLLRIYDLLAVQGLTANPEATNQVLELHQRGGLISPPPYFIPPEDIEEAVNNAESTPDSQSTDNIDT